MDKHPYKSFRIASDIEHICIVDEILKGENFSVEHIDFYPRARVCRGGEKIGSSILNFFGHIYIQDLSSMLPPLFLAPQRGSLVLDLCASPGGKTAILSELVGMNGCVIANEPNKKRYMTLQKNIERLNLLNVCTSSYRGEDFPEYVQFSHILLDVPCSGWGTVEKNPRVLRLWKGKKILPLIRLQRRLIEKAYTLLRPGGVLIYSTCTTNRAENEDQLLWAIDNFNFEIVPLHKIDSFIYNEEKIPGVISIKGHELYSQGFFVGCLKKDSLSKESCLAEEVREDKMGDEILDFHFIKNLIERETLSLAGFPQGVFYKKKDRVFFKREFAGSHLLKTEGVFVGRIKGDMFFPNWKIWRFMQHNTDNKLVIEDLEKIRGLISGKSLFFQTKSRFVQLFYKDLPLSLLKVKGGRCLISN